MMNKKMQRVVVIIMAAVLIFSMVVTGLAAYLH